MTLWITLGVVTLLALVLGFAGIKLIRPFEKGLVERLGKYSRTAESGLQFIIPFFERMVKFDVREKVIDVPPQEVITKDNVVVAVDAIIYYEITDVYMVLYNINNFEVAAIKLAQTNLRNVIGEMELDESLTSRERINTKLREVLDDATDKWGVKVTRVELKKIDPPNDIMEAMSRQMKAERTKRAAILEADGIKQAQILRAEGERQAAILEAEGKSESMKLVADAQKYKLIAEANGQAEAIMRVYDSIHKGNPTKDLITVKYLDALKDISNGQATKIFLPMEASGILGSLASVGEMFRNDTDSSKKS